MAKKSSIETDLPPLAKNILKSLVGENQIQKSEKGKLKLNFAATTDELSKEETLAYDQKLKDASPLVKSILNVLNGPGKTIERLAFETNPSQGNIYHSLYRHKLRLLPDEVLKRISIQDDLIAAIVNTRSNQISAFGRPQPDRFSTGYRIEPEPGLMEKLSDEQKTELNNRIAGVEAKLLTCGKTKGYNDTDVMNLSQFLFMSTRNAVVFGRTATEIIWALDQNGQKAFHSFRPIDAGTIYRASNQKDAAAGVRKQALYLLQQLQNKKLEPEKFVNDEYSWIQVIDSKPVQAFTSEECFVHSFYPVTDVELDGYPLTPLDTVIAAVTMHLNITNHNKLYFQNGRAARGMIVVRSDDVDDNTMLSIRQHFQASINSATNSWRMPIFGVGSDDEISWQPMDSGGHDMEFQYLSDTNARVILSAFQMSPEEIPGYSHLSRGSNAQTLSETNNEYRLTAHRDAGIRPLLAQFQNFINSRILPLLDEEVAKNCSFKFVGLEAETAERESIRLQQDMSVHMTIDEVLEKVQKEPMGLEYGGRFLLNPAWQAILDKYVPVGKIMEKFFGVEGASKRPEFQYLRDPFYFNWVQVQQQMQMQQQQQQMAQQQAQVTPQEQGGQQQQQSEDLTRSLDQAIGLLSKGEQQLSPSKRRLLVQQNKVIEHALKSFERESRTTLDDILDIVDQHLPANKKK